ncbi:MAG: hypothetical protein QOG99_2563 [Frankiales bacterium]|nr:hypothetical protein [Frankiales bacterium]
MPGRDAGGALIDENGGVTITDTAPPAAPARKRRGRETVLDMIRTLAVVFALVVPLWFFGQASPSDSKAIRPVDPSETYKDYHAVTGGPAPSTPAGWVANVQAYDGEVARVGYVHQKHYMEWQGSTGTAWVDDATGRGSRTGTVTVAGAVWQLWEDGSGHTSLVRTFGKATSLVGGIRELATLAELESLAATLPAA